MGRTIRQKKFIPGWTHKGKWKHWLGRVNPFCILISPYIEHLSQLKHYKFCYVNIEMEGPRRGVSRTKLLNSVFLNTKNGNGIFSKMKFMVVLWTLSRILIHIVGVVHFHCLLFYTMWWMVQWSWAVCNFQLFTQFCDNVLFILVLLRTFWL